MTAPLDINDVVSLVNGEYQRACLIDGHWEHEVVGVITQMNPMTVRLIKGELDDSDAR